MGLSSVLMTHFTLHSTSEVLSAATFC